MPLPANGTPWPPKELAVVRGKYNEWGAWYSGDSLALSIAYQRTDVVRPSLRPSQFRGGIVGSIARTFWGAPNTTNMPKQKLHVPVAGDLCQASADLLFAEPPTFTVEGSTDVQDRLVELIDDGALTTLAEGAEVGAAFGDSYLRTTWDKEVVPDGPFFTAIHADAVLPEFRWGRLVAATIWHVVRQDGQTVWRHLERHELDSQGVGVILHGLYQGSPTDLGHAVALADSDATVDIQVNADGLISTESPGLALTHVPNQRPNRRWRNEPLASNFGRSDLDGVEALMDSLDETYTSWMRDVRLGKARLLLGQNALEQLDPGQGLAFDTEREVFTPLNLPPSAMSSDGGSSIAQAVQFTIRHAEHKATADELLGKILRTAGYSTSTFGDDGDTVMTATEVQARQQRSFMTRDRKIRIWRPALAEAVQKLMAVDKAIFGNAGPGTEEPDVQFPDGVQESMLTLAQTALALSQAEAASTKVKVQLLHPDWDDDQVDEEVAAIAAMAPKMPDPSQFFPSDGPPAGPPSQPAVPPVA